MKSRLSLALWCAVAVLPLACRPSRPVLKPSLDPQLARSDAPLAPWIRSERLVSTYTESRQEDGSIAVDARGRLFVVWQSRRQEGAHYGVFGQLLDPLGRPLGTELHLNQTRDGSQWDVNAAFGPDGTAWVAWASAHPRTDANGIVLRPFADGSAGFGPAADERLVAGNPRDRYLDPVVAVDRDGTILCAWVRQFEGGAALEARRFGPGGEPLGPVFALAADAAPVDPEEADGRRRSRASVPDVAARARSGQTPAGFACVWARAEPSGVPAGLFGRVLAPDGTLGPELALDDRPDECAVEPDLDVDADGNWVVAWMAAPATGDLEGDPGYRVRARRFGREGAPLAPSFAVELGGAGTRSAATAIVAPDGGFLVACNVQKHAKYVKPNGKVGRFIDVRARRFEADGTPRGEGFQVNEPSRGRHSFRNSQSARRAVWTALDQIAFAWHGNVGGDGWGQGLTLFVPPGLDVPAPAPVEPVAACEGDFRGAGAYPTIAPPVVRNAQRRRSFAGAPGGFVAHDMTGWEPPDPDIAVGPNHIVTQVNQEIAWFTKDGVEQHRQDNTGAGGFWGALGAENFVFDPICVFDPHIQRFVVANSELASDGDYLVLAVSITDDPNDGWHRYRHKVSPTCGFPDFPNLGLNDQAIFITSDCFNGGGNRTFIYDKGIVANGLPLPSLASVQTSSTLISLGNTKNHDAGTPAHYLVTSSGGGGNLRVRAIVDPNGSPQVFVRNVPVSGWSGPPDAQQAGSSNLLDTIDTRIKNGVVRNGRLYCAHGVGDGGVTRVRWYEIDLRGWPTSGNNPELVQEVTLDYGPSVFTWFPDIGVTPAGHVALAFSRSSPNELPAIHTTFQRANDPLGTVRSSKSLQVSSSPYNGGRWGDYSGLDDDPADPNHFWSHAIYSEGPWTTWAGRFTVPAQPGVRVDVRAPVASPGPRIEGPLPGVVGTNVVYALGSVPNTPVVVAWGLAPGNTSAGCGQTRWSIFSPFVTDAFQANAAGTATVVLSIPPSVAGLTVRFQAMNLTNCSVGDVVEHVFP